MPWASLPSMLTTIANEATDAVIRHLDPKMHKRGSAGLLAVLCADMPIRAAILRTESGWS